MATGVGSIMDVNDDWTNSNDEVGVRVCVCRRTLLFFAPAQGCLWLGLATTPFSRPH